MKNPSTFDYLDSINETKEDLMDSSNEKDYQSYLINHFMGGRIDTIFHAVFLNQYPFLDKRLQYDYLRHAVRRQKRRVKWIKSNKIEDISLIQSYYKCNITRAKEILEVISEEKINEIKDFLDPGGNK